ncbi:MAG: hypothetical protein MHM6MM_003735 [Cercozoa sp. M6MM]
MSHLIPGRLVVARWDDGYFYPAFVCDDFTDLSEKVHVRFRDYEEEAWLSRTDVKEHPDEAAQEEDYRPSELVPMPRVSQLPEAPVLPRDEHESEDIDNSLEENRPSPLQVEDDANIPTIQRVRNESGAKDIQTVLATTPRVQISHGATTEEESKVAVAEPEKPQSTVPLPKTRAHEILAETLRRKSSVRMRSRKERWCVLNTRRDLTLRFFKNTRSDTPDGPGVDLRGLKECARYSADFRNRRGKPKPPHTMYLVTADDETVDLTFTDDATMAPWFELLSSLVVTSQPTQASVDDAIFGDELDIVQGKCGSCYTPELAHTALQVLPKIEQDDLVCFGWLDKRGEHNTAWKRRFFDVDGRRHGLKMRYFRDRAPVSILEGGTDASGSNVDDGELGHIDLDEVLALRAAEDAGASPYAFSLLTPSRVWTLCANNRRDYAKWCTFLGNVLRRTGCTSAKHKVLRAEWLTVRSRRRKLQRFYVALFEGHLLWFTNEASFALFVAQEQEDMRQLMIQLKRGRPCAAAGGVDLCELELQTQEANVEERIECRVDRSHMLTLIADGKYAARCWWRFLHRQLGLTRQRALESVRRSRSSVSRLSTNNEHFVD